MDENGVDLVKLAHMTDNRLVKYSYETYSKGD